MKLIKLKVANDSDKSNYKILEVPANMTLYKFAGVIVKGFGFYFDHAFGFYDNLNNPFDSEDFYELFTDIDDVEDTPNAKGVKRYYFVGDLFEKNNKMLFLFDYGDGWRFTLDLLDSSEEVYDVPRNYYKVYESHGENPDQYPEVDPEGLE